MLTRDRLLGSRTVERISGDDVETIPIEDLCLGNVCRWDGVHYRLEVSRKELRLGTLGHCAGYLVEGTLWWRSNSASGGMQYPINDLIRPFGEIDERRALEMDATRLVREVIFVPVDELLIKPQMAASSVLVPRALLADTVGDGNEHIFRQPDWSGFP